MSIECNGDAGWWDDVDLVADADPVLVALNGGNA
jgi:hypothetical protein